MWYDNNIDSKYFLSMHHFCVLSKQWSFIYVFTENVYHETAKLSYVTIGYLRRWCDWTKWHNSIKLDLSRLTSD